MLRGGLFSPGELWGALASRRIVDLCRHEEQVETLDIYIPTVDI